MCRTGCKTGGHRSWGECARAARISVWGPNHETYVYGDRETEFFDQAIADGLEPEGIYREDVEKAYRKKETDDAVAAFIAEG